MREKYQRDVVPALTKEFNYRNPMEVPKVEKVVINIGMGEALQNAKSMEAALADLTAITGQKPVVTRARKSIANFKLREGQAIGAMVTLRGEKMYEFLDRLISIALPRIRDFRGVSRRSFDGRGNYSIGLREQIVFPEVDYDRVDKLRGLEVAIVTSASSDNEGYALLKNFGMPFSD
jgi:large subunit ribosomal protein L5